MRLIDYLHKAHVKIDPDTQVLIADTIWDDIDKGPDTQVWARSDFPCLSPLFPSLLVEAYASQTGVLAGILFTDITNRPDFKNYDSPPSNAHWVLTAEGFGLVGTLVFRFPGLAFLHLDETGQFCDAEGDLHVLELVSAANLSLEERVERQLLSMPAFTNLLPFAMKAVSIAHCKNIQLAPLQPSRQQRRQLERQKLPVVTYKTLTIRPVSAKASEPPKAYQGLLRSHVVRGHFRTYTSDAPLFGKFVGTWWVENFVRGEPERGEIKKQYKTP